MTLPSITTRPTRLQRKRHLFNTNLYYLWTAQTVLRVNIEGCRLVEVKRRRLTSRSRRCNRIPCEILLSSTKNTASRVL
jgi:hypothetical protein